MVHFETHKLTRNNPQKIISLLLKLNKRPVGILTGQSGTCVSLDNAYCEQGLSEIKREVKQSMDLAQTKTTHYPKDWKSQIGHFNLLMTFTHTVLP